jgi:long-chain fatty acid transport protein
MKLKSIVTLLIAGGLVSPLAYATNGMNMEGYGPVAASMGGASMAYDNGTAAVINNPATLGLMASGASRLDVAVGDLMPDAVSQGQSSQAKNFYMPAFGYVRKVNNLAYGIGMMAQGGMGTDFADSSAFGPLFSANLTNGTGAPLATQALQNKSEVGVGRLIFPVAYSVSPDLNIGGSIDYVWAGMDLKWVLDGTHFADMMPTSMNPGATHTFGDVAATSTLLAPFGAAIGNGAGQFTTLNYGYFDFNTTSSFNQKAKGAGYAGNIGFTFKVNPQMSIGGVYHAKTSISDMKTGTSEATASFNVSGAGVGGTMTIALPGQVVVKNFQWPETYGIGLSYQATDQWQIVADYKLIGWKSVMKNFNMSFISDGSAGNAAFGMANKTLDLTYYQNWKDQNVVQLGAAYKYNDALTLRFGGNFANNPIPDSTVTPLFPAIMKTHYTGGLGYVFSKANSMDVSFVYAPKVTATNNWSAAGGSNQTISLGGTSWQAMYSHNF